MKEFKIQIEDWADADEIILKASFQAFVEFIDKNPDWKDCICGSDYYNPQIKATAEMLYTWWTEVRPNRKDPLDDIEDDEIPPMEFEEIPGTDLSKLLDYDLNKYRKWNDMSRLSSICEVEDQEMLFKLVSIREHLWS